MSSPAFLYRVMSPLVVAGFACRLHDVIVIRPLSVLSEFTIVRKPSRRPRLHLHKAAKT